MAQHHAKSNRHRIVWILAALLLVLALGMRHLIRRGDLPTRGRGGYHVEPHVTHFSVFGSYATLTFWAPERSAAVAAEHIGGYLQKLHDAINLFDPESELSRLNAHAAEAPFECGMRLWRMLEEARRAWGETDGAFDVSVGPLMKLWGFHQERTTLPTEEDVRAVMPAVGLDRITFDDDRHTVRFHHPDTYLDLGGIAKGYALDRALDIARMHGITVGLIDLGGNVGCLAEPPPGHTGYTIGVRDPFNRDRLLGTVQVTNCAVATSGNYEKTVEIEGRKVHHIIDPRNGYPVPDVASVTVITPRGVDSDTFSTAIFVEGHSLARWLRRTRQRTHVLRVELGPTGKSQVHKFGWIWSVKSN